VHGDHVLLAYPNDLCGSYDTLVEVYPCALSLSRILFDKERVRSRVPLKGSNYVMAMVVVVAKLFLGLDGKKRFE